MKTIPEIKKEIEGLLSYLETNRDKRIKKRGRKAETLFDYEAEKKRVTNRIVFLNLVIKYLESGPTLQFCQQEASRVLKRINHLDDMFPAYLDERRKEESQLDEKREKTKYRTQVEYAVFQKQLATLRFIIGNGK